MPILYLITQDRAYQRGRRDFYYDVFVPYHEKILQMSEDAVISSHKVSEAWDDLVKSMDEQEQLKKLRRR